MTTSSLSIIPAWKDGKGNRFIVLAKNHVFKSIDEMIAWRISNGLYYATFGWTFDGHIEIDLSPGGQGEIPHVPAKGPYNFDLAVIGGPIYDEVYATSEAREGTTTS